MNKQEKKELAQKHEQAHIKLLQNVYGYNGDSIKPLRAIEESMHKIAEEACNGTITDEQYAAYEETATNEVSKLFKSLPDGFFINADPRGYALKIDDKLARSTDIYKDFGGYGILAPESFSW